MTETRRNGERPCALADEVGRPRLTDDHDGELNTLLDLVAPASSGERHCGWRINWSAEETTWTTATAFAWNTKVGWVVGRFKLRLSGRSCVRTIPIWRRALSSIALWPQDLLFPAYMLSAPSPSIACCARRAVLTRFSRSFCASQSYSLPVTEETTSLKKPTVTRKKYAELPTARVLSDGTTASPLEEWTGRLRQPAVAYEHVPSSIRAHIPCTAIKSCLMPPQPMVMSNQRPVHVFQLPNEWLAAQNLSRV